MKNKKAVFITQGAVIAAIYVVLVIVFDYWSFGPIQFRVAEALTILPYFTPAAIPGLVLCQDLVQVKMRNFSHFNPPEAQPQCVFFHTIVRIHLVTYSYNGYEFVSYCRKLPDIRKSSGMPACNREF